MQLSLATLQLRQIWFDLKKHLDLLRAATLSLPHVKQLSNTYPHHNQRVTHWRHIKQGSSPSTNWKCTQLNCVSRKHISIAGLFLDRFQQVGYCTRWSLAVKQHREWWKRNPRWRFVPFNQRVDHDTTHNSLSREQTFNCRSSVSRQICDKLDSFPDDCPNYNQSTTHRRRVKAGCSFPSQKVCATRHRANKLLVVCQAFLDRFLKIG